MKFQWDENKRKANLKKHGIDFVRSLKIFDDLNRIEWIDKRKNYGEARYRTIGEIDGLIIHVVYTLRGDFCRIISARRAKKDERYTYIHTK